MKKEKEYKFQKAHTVKRGYAGVISAPGSAVECWECGRIKSTALMWADLNGPAFRAYYCDQCKRHIEETEDIKC